MVFVIEAIVLCLVFTVADIVPLMLGKNPLDWVYDQPEKIINHCYELGLIHSKEKIKDKRTIIKKLIGALFILIVFSLIIRYINKETTFLKGFMISYGLWFIVDWFDCIFIDWIFVCNTGLYVIKGTEDIKDAYKDYAFHATGSLKGMIAGIPVCLIAGLIVSILP
ncbi:MAG: hypothetical protein Q4D13_06610 [Erysipelotrichaceae bacterium]|nr:hypothetical protein [Erysipelotrichaceae bacterium]